MKNKNNSKKIVKRNKKKIWKVLGIILGILVLLYFIAKIIFINIYITPNLTYIDVKVDDIGDINNTLVDDYYVYDNLKFRNDFQDYEVINENEYDEEIKDKSIALKNNKTNQALILLIRENMFSLEDFELNILEETYLKLSGWNLKNEKEVILKAANEIKDGFNIFDSFHKILFSTMINSAIIADNDFSIFTTDELEGYILKNVTDNNVKFINIFILKDDKVYSITLIDKENEISDEYVKDFISTIVIN